MITTKAHRTLRPSFANLVSKCVAAAHGDEDRFVIDWEGDAAGRVGSALHVAAKALVRKEEIPLDEIYCKYGLKASERRDLAILIACVRKYCAEQLHTAGWDQRLVTEERLEGVFETETTIYDLGGTMDVGGFSADQTIWGTIDWKTTRLQNADYAAQQMIYLWLAKEWIKKHLPPHRWPQYYQYHIVFVRDWTEEVSEAYTADQLDHWLAGFLDRVESWDGREYNPGGACIYCPRQADCPAVYAMLTAMARALDDGRFTETAERASDDELVHFKVQAGAVGNLIRNAMDLLKALVVGRGGEIAGDEGVLAITPKQRAVIDPLKAWPICEEELTDEQIANAVTLSKTALLDEIGKLAPRGQKTKAKEEFWARLEDAEAVEVNEYVELRLKKGKTVTTNFED